MKKLIILIITVHCSLLTAHLYSQPCLPEGITFSTQAQIDSFQIYYPGCAEIEGGVHIIGDDIMNLNGLSVLTSIGGHLYIENNDALTSLSGLEDLTSIGDYLFVFGNGALTSLTGLNNLTSIGGGLYIWDNYALTSFTGLNNLISIGGGINIWANYVLTSLSALNNVTSIGGELRIWQNYALTSLTGLDNVTSIGGFLDIYYNDALTSLTALKSVTSIGSSLRIEYNMALNSLIGLENVTSIGDFLSVIDNDALTSLTGLDNINAESIEDLNIYANPLLSHCEVESICEYLNSNGTAVIHNNAEGCNSPEEIQDSCEANAVTIEVRYILENLSVSPNPVITITTISYTLVKPQDVHFTVYNVQSQIVSTMQERQDAGEQKIQWNAEGMPAGMYYYRIVAGKQTASGKLIVSQ